MWLVTAFLPLLALADMAAQDGVDASKARMPVLPGEQRGWKAQMCMTDQQKLASSYHGIHMRDPL